MAYNSVTIGMCGEISVTSILLKIIYLFIIDKHISKCVAGELKVPGHYITIHVRCGSGHKECHFLLMRFQGCQMLCTAE